MSHIYHNIKASYLFRSVIFFIVFISAFVGVSSAELTNPDLPNREGIKIGDSNMLLHSAFRTKEMLDTNIYLDNTDRKFDSITAMAGQVGFEIPFGDNSFSADYVIEQFLYGTYHEENHTDHRVRGLLEFNLTDYVVTVKDNFNRFTNRASNEDSVRLKQENNEFRAGVEAHFERLGFDVGYNNLITYYDSNDASDITAGQMTTYRDKSYMTNLIDMTVSYKFMPKTYFLFENDLGFIDYYNSSLPPNSYFDETLVGVKGQWFSKSNINLKAGFRYQSYDKSDIYADKDYVGAVIRGGFDYTPTDRDIVVISLERSVRESTYANMNYYNLNMAGFTYRHNFNDKLSFNLSGVYQLNLYPSESTENGETAKRNDNYYIAGAGIRYDMRKWISFEARYDFTNKTSTFDIFDYVDNVASIRGTVGF